MQSKALAYSKKQKICFLEFPCFLHDPMNVGNFISGSSAFSKTSLNIKEFTVHILLKPGLENFEHYFTTGTIKNAALSFVIVQKTRDEAGR